MVRFAPGRIVNELDQVVHAGDLHNVLGPNIHRRREKKPMRADNRLRLAYHLARRHHFQPTLNAGRLQR
jgi:hypothetical protein